MKRAEIVCRVVCFLDVDECQSSPCHADAGCSNGPGSFRCQCRPGFHGDGFALCENISDLIVAAITSSLDTTIVCIRFPLCFHFRWRSET